jgi:hypothetical protein
MHLLLTKFHMYLENIILQVTNTNTWKIPLKNAFQTLIRAKKQGRRPPNQAKLGEAPRGTNPCPTHSPPHKGSGEMAWSGTGRSLGLAAPSLVPLSHSFLSQWHGSMLSRCILCLHAKDRQMHRHSSGINRGAHPLSNTPQHLEE